MDAKVSGAVVDKEVGLKAEVVAEPIKNAVAAVAPPAKLVMHQAPDIIKEYMKSLAKRCSGEANYLNTGFSSIDEGFPAALSGGHLIILAARPGMGKTSLAQQIMENVAAQDRTAIFLSLEMSAHELAERSIVRRTGISMGKLKTGKLTDDEWEKITQASQEFAALPILVNDYGSDLTTLTENITKDAEGLAAHGLPPLGLIVLDYLQLTSAKGANKNEQMGTVSGGMKCLARKLNVPVIALSQLSRKCEERVDSRPLMSDLRDSGNIEQDADLIAMLYRDEDYNSGTADAGIAEFISQKNRHGAKGTVRLAWCGERFEFGDVK